VTVHELATGLGLARGGPDRTLNIYLLGNVVIDSGSALEPPPPRAATRSPADHRARAHHAHFDHAGSSAWLCRTFDVPPDHGHPSAASSSADVRTARKFTETGDPGDGAARAPGRAAT
ncbi:MAG: hypothetical protein ACRDTT_22125, partial [Pseudonocardiaceae bacterium]